MNEVARGVVGWDCPEGAGHPICITTTNGTDDSLSVDLFLRDNDIVGVCVYRECDLVAAVGELPLPVINEERNALGLSSLTPSTWGAAKSIYTEVAA